MHEDGGRETADCRDIWQCGRVYSTKNGGEQHSMVFEFAEGRDLPSEQFHILGDTTDRLDDFLRRRVLQQVAFRADRHLVSSGLIGATLSAVAWSITSFVTSSGLLITLLLI